MLIKDRALKLENRVMNNHGTLIMAKRLAETNHSALKLEGKRNVDLP